MRKLKIKKDINKFKKTIGLLIVFLSLLLCLIVFFLMSSFINLKLYQNNDLIIEVNSNYNIYDVKVISLFKEKDIDVFGNVDINVIGEYNITYKMGLNEVKRKVRVVDTTKPSIIFPEKDLMIPRGEKFVNNDYKAIDNYDGDITNNVVIEGSVNTNEVGTYMLTYRVKDSSLNETIINRNVVVYESVNNLINELENYIKDNNYNVSIGYVNLNDDYTYNYNPNKTYFAASLIKTLDALYIYSNDLVNNITRELVSKAISVSDNASHFRLLDYIGYNILKQYGLSLGAKYTLSGTGEFGITNVSDQIVYLKELYSLIINSDYKDELISYFNNDFGNHLYFDGLPTILHKYGYSLRYFHDVGIVLDNNPYIIVILTTEAYNDYENIINDISQKIYKIHQVYNDNLVKLM